MPKAPSKEQAETEIGALERMNNALKAALGTPPRKHADEPKRGKEGARRAKRDGRK